MPFDTTRMASYKGTIATLHLHIVTPVNVHQVNSCGLNQQDLDCAKIVLSGNLRGVWHNQRLKVKESIKTSLQKNLVVYSPVHLKFQTKVQNV